MPTQTGPVWKYDELQIACGWEVKVSRSTRQHFCVHLDSGEIQQRAAPACAWRGTRRRGGAEDCCKVLEAVEVPVAEHKAATLVGSFRIMMAEDSHRRACDRVRRARPPSTPLIAKPVTSSQLAL